MSDLNHILYTTISFAITAILLFAFAKLLRSPKTKIAVLKISACLTLILHFSSLYVDFFTTGSAEVADSMILPLYPCNVAMWLLVIVAFKREKSDKAFKFLAEGTFYLGIVGGVVGIVFNEVYINTPDLTDWDVLQGLLSHSTMLLGCLWLLVGGYIRFRVDNVISVAGVLLLLLADGGLMIGLFKAFRLDPPNCMYLLENPFPTIPWFNSFLLGAVGLLLVFALTALYEKLVLPREERWYVKLQNKYKKTNEEDMKI